MTPVTHLEAPIGHNGPSNHAGPPAEVSVEPPTQQPTNNPSGTVPLRLQDGVPGLSAATSWNLTSLAQEPGDNPVFYLLSVEDDPDTALILADPWSFCGDYSPDLPDSELEALGVTHVGEAMVMCSVTLDADKSCVFLNLLGPFVFHTSTGAGCQLVLSDQDWPVRARVEIGT